MLTGRRLRRALRGLTPDEQRVFMAASRRFHSYLAPRHDTAGVEPLPESRREPGRDPMQPQRFERRDPGRDQARDPERCRVTWPLAVAARGQVRPIRGER